MTSFHTVKKQVCEEFNISLTDFNGPSRVRVVTAARRLAWWRAYKSMKISLSRLGAMSGNRHIATVWHGIKLQEHIFMGTVFEAGVQKAVRAKKFYQDRKARGLI
jgi:chromosomal replication initiation ATPase DnaA